MNHKIKHFKFFLTRNRAEEGLTQSKQRQLGRAFAKIAKPTSKIPQPSKPKSRYEQKMALRRNQIIIISSLKLLQPSTPSPTSPSLSKKSPMTRLTTDKNVKILHDRVKNRRVSAVNSPCSTLLHQEDIFHKSKPQYQRIKSTKHNTQKSPYQSKLLTKYINKHQRGVSMKVPENGYNHDKKDNKFAISCWSTELKHLKSQSYLVMEYPSQNIIASKKSRAKMEIASLTKIMTFYVILQIIKQNNIDPKIAKVKVSAQCTKLCGTTAGLEEGQEYTVLSLLYGMMLPSGNDAASELASWGGQFLTNHTKRKSKIYAFVQEMNRFCSKLSLTSTNFSNSHGLTHPDAWSTAKDVAVICCACMEFQLFRQVVGCKIFSCKAISQQSQRLVQWKNTNKLLKIEGFLGLKTGTTISAGPCLASAYRFRNNIYLTVLLKAPNPSSRFKQTCEILSYSLLRVFTDIDHSEREQLQGLTSYCSQAIQDENQAKDRAGTKFDRQRAKTELSNDIFYGTN